MVLPPNRIGGARGVDGRTLTDLYDVLALMLAELQGIKTAQDDIQVQVTALVQNTGAPADTTCDLNQLELLCSIYTAINGETPSDEPPVICPGYEGSIYNPVRVWTWEQDYNVLDNVPNGVWYGIPEVIQGTAPNLYYEGYAPYPEFPLYGVPALRTTTNLTNLCVSYEKTGGAFTILGEVYSSVDGSYVYADTINGTEANNGTGSKVFTLDADQHMRFKVYSVNGPVTTTPQARVWVTQGAFG